MRLRLLSLEDRDPDFPALPTTKPGKRVKKATIISWFHQHKIDWKLLVLLVLLLNVKLLVKIAAVVLIYIMRPDFKFGFRLRNSRLPLFYCAMIAIGIFNWLVSGLFTQFNYNLVLLAGLFFWVMCILIIHQVKLAIEKNQVSTIYNTITVFFLLNALVSLAIFASIVWETGTINPYRYQGEYQKYFIGTGDYIKGLSLDTSTTNAVLNGFGVIWFLQRHQYGLVILCMLVLLLTGSNVTNLLLVATLVFMFFFQTNKAQKSITVVCLLMLVSFMVKISPQNNRYLAGIYKKVFNIKTKPEVPVIISSITLKPDSMLNAEERRQKFAQLYMDSVNAAVEHRKTATWPDPSLNMLVTAYNAKPVIPVPNIHTPPFQHRGDTSEVEKKLMSFVAKNETEVPIASGIILSRRLPGKLIAVKQTARYFYDYPLAIITGTGIGNFSSKLAFRATAMNIAGGFPARYAYINSDFKTNHLHLYLYYFTRKDEMHSVANSPNSTYDQLLSEYGLAGFAAFIFLYIVFFAKQVNRYSYALPLLLFMLGVFFVDYWFEQLSVVIFFELLLMLNLKETKNNHDDAVLA